MEMSQCGIDLQTAPAFGEFIQMISCKPPINNLVIEYMWVLSGSATEQHMPFNNGCLFIHCGPRKQLISTQHMLAYFYQVIVRTPEQWKINMSEYRICLYQ